MTAIEEKEIVINKNTFNIKEFNDIILLFPESISSESLVKEFILSLNDIRQSNFLSTLIDNIDKDNSYIGDDNILINDNITIKIPSNLYNGLRYIDLYLFIDLWKGKKCLNQSIIDDKIHNLRAIKKVCDSLTLNEDLYFVKKLMQMYPYRQK